MAFHYTAYILGIIIIFSGFAPYLFVSKGSVDFSKLNIIDDTIGGVMNPFIIFPVAFLASLAFYMQLWANNLQIRQFSSTQKDQSNALKEQAFFRLADNLYQKVLMEHAQLAEICKIFD